MRHKIFLTILAFILVVVIGWLLWIDRNIPAQDKIVEQAPGIQHDTSSAVSQEPTLGEGSPAWLLVPAPGFETIPEQIVAEEGNQDEVIPVQQFTIEAGGFYFRPSTLTVQKGVPVEITIQNKGSHTFTIDELGVDVPLRGADGVVTFTPDRIGTFQFYCAVPGHREAGQVGAITVVE